MRQRVHTPEQKRANAERAARWGKANPERRRKIKKAFYARHREQILAEAKAKCAAKPKAPRPPAKGRDPEKARIRQRRWQEKNKDLKNAKQRKRRAENLAQVRAKDAAYRRLNGKRLRANSRRWDAAHPEVRRAHTRGRRARKLNAAGHHTGRDIELIRAAQRDRCGCCKTRLNGKGHVDHIVALSRGGSNWPSNLQLLCRSCNSSKHDRDPIEFMRSRGRLL